MALFHQIYKEAQILQNHIIAYPPHLHRALEIVRLQSGAATATLNGSSYEMRAGDLIFVFPDVIHSYTARCEVETVKLIFSPDDTPDLLCTLTEQIPLSPHIPAELLEKTTIPALLDEILSQYETSSFAVRRAYLALLTGKLAELSGTVRRENISHDTVYDVLSYCRTHCLENISLQNVADALHFSRSHISHIFCQKLKINFREYISRLRLEEAVPLILRGDLTMEEISAKCGFCATRSFYRAFSEYFGQTPKQYITDTSGRNR